MVLPDLTCACCLAIFKKTHENRHMNTVHAADGVTPKTAAELNIAENRGIGRWHECRYCSLKYVGVKNHEPKCKSRPAVEAEAPEGPAAVVAENIANNNEEINDGNINEENMNNVEENVENIIPPAAEVVVTDWGMVIAKFNKGLYSPSKESIPYLKELTTILLNQAAEANDERSTKGVLGFLLLPGMVQFLKESNKLKLIKPQDWLRGAVGSPDKAEFMMQSALDFEKLLKERNIVYKTETLESRKAEIELLIKDGRFGAARKRADGMEEFLKGNEQQRGAMSEAELDIMLARLFPKRNDQDILPPASTDPPIAECLLLTAEQIRQRAYKLSTQSCSGSNAWTMRCFKFMFNDKNDIGYGPDTPPGPLHQAMADFCNKCISNQMCPEARDWLTTVRLILIEKTPGGPLERPICCEIHGGCSSVSDSSTVC